MAQSAATAHRHRVSRRALGAALSELSQVFDGRLSTAKSIRQQHCDTSSWLTPQPPDAVIMVRTTEEAQLVVRSCARHGVPIIPFGAGTSLEGQVNAPHGGVSLDLSGMRQILQVNHADLDCVVEPGVTRLQLNQFIRDQGVFFPIDPGTDATIGGMASTRASGTTAVRYGTMRENVVAVKAILPSGEIISTAGRARKSSAGYDLTRLMVGAAGTLGVITEITLRLHGIPDKIAAGVCSFATLEGACTASSQAILAGIPVARIELLDALMARICNSHAGLALAEQPTLFLEFHGSEHAVSEQAALFKDIAIDNGSTDFQWALRSEDRARLWKARHAISSACRAWRPGARFLGTDACVPISRLAECVTDTMEELAQLELFGAATGHVGDGNFHVAVMIDADNPAELKRAARFTEKLALRAIRMGGTCTGEHGIGQGKMNYLEVEAGASLDVMRAIKHAIDPENIMNPGKIFWPRRLGRTSTHAAQPSG